MERLRRRVGPLWMLALLLVTRLEVLRLRRQVERMDVDPAFGCLTRQGAERRLRTLRGPREVVFFDVDDLHTLNARVGYAEVDRRIRAALAGVRVRQDDLILGRWYSGDELFAVVPAGSGAGLCRRLERALEGHGLSATFALVPWRGSLNDTVEVAASRVRQAKRPSARGSAGVTGEATGANGGDTREVDNQEKQATIIHTSMREETKDAGTSAD